MSLRAMLLGQVWDVATQQCEHTLSWHSDKVQAVAWNPAEAPVLLSGGFDKQVVLVRLMLQQDLHKQSLQCPSCDCHASAHEQSLSLGSRNC